MSILAGSTGRVPYPQNLRDVGLPIDDGLGVVYGTSLGNRNRFNVADAVNFMQSRFKEDGDEDYRYFQCGKYTREAIEEGLGTPISRPARSASGEVSAADYGSSLIRAGFNTISKENYQPELGDVIIFDRIPNHNDGHMQMYTQKGWGSDRINRDQYPDRGSFYPSRDYRDSPYAIYRHPK
jgi:hypothetical protein